MTTIVVTTDDLRQLAHYVQIQEPGGDLDMAVKQVQGGTEITVYQCDYCKQEFRVAGCAPFAVKEGDGGRRFREALARVRETEARLTSEHVCPDPRD